jgi:adenosylcobinamide kinase/adenosylcobinamide-phosphate guanylyltransferase
VATAAAGDEEMRKRIEEHKKARPPTWGLLETTSNIGRQILLKIGEAQIVIVDCITLLVSNSISQYTAQISEAGDTSPVEQKLTAEINGLAECIQQVESSFVIVTNEVGMGLVSTNRVGRLYRDLLGQANQRLAEVADEVYLMVAGLPLQIKPAPHFRHKNAEVP